MTRNRHTLGLLAVAAMVVLSGCGTGGQYWELSVYGDVTASDGDRTFDGRVELHGKISEVAVRDVSVVFLGPGNETINAVPVGELNENHRLENISVQLNQTPQSVRVVAGSIKSPEDARYGFTGLTRTENDDYRPYDQETTRD